MAEYQGVVVNAKGDPKKLLRVQVRIPGLMDGVPDDKLPWATYKLPIGAGAGRGDFTPVQNGDSVWVDFPYRTHGKEDTRQPRITGSVHSAPGGTVLAPGESVGNSYSHNRDGIGALPAANGGYNSSKVTTFHGSTIEYVEGGTIRIFSNVSGALIEMRADGKVFVKGDLHVDGDVIANNVSLKNHVHLEIKKGAEKSGKPDQ